MKRFIRSELRKTLPYSIMITAISLVVFLLNGFRIREEYAIFHKIELWTIASQYLCLVYIFIAVIPVCWVMVHERKDNYLLYAVARMDKRKYILSKWFISAGSSACSIFFISFLSLIFILAFFPKIHYVLPLSEDYALTDYYKGYYFVNYPVLYGFLLSIWRAVIAFLYTSLGFVLSLYVKNLFVVAATPFMFDLLDSFLLGSSGFSAYEVMTSVDLHRVRCEIINKNTFIVSAVTILVEICLVIIYYRFISRKQIVEL